MIFPNPIGEEWSSLHVYRASLDSELAESSGAAVSTTVAAAESHRDDPTTAVLTTSTSGQAASGHVTNHHHGHQNHTSHTGRGRPKKVRESETSNATGKYSSWLLGVHTIFFP
ncbi:unnamed protein product [Protopolystoma xenopodis]|uniref:Uncharacterized protein n=1 Tax=Protopolystoma xenopodis TaxID=117903 RepID=A0A3S5FF18_9PLAT|nr:unnamed protein product [Protopolystoma xenopodis]